MQKMKLFPPHNLVLVAAIALSFCIACNSAPSTIAPSPGGGPKAHVIRIASQSPLSGNRYLSSLGTAIRNGADLAIQQNKKALEDLGFQVQYVPYDDQATPDVGVSNAHDIVADTAILAVIGHLNSGVAIPSSQIYVLDHLVMISPANTNP